MVCFLRENASAKQKPLTNKSAAITQEGRPKGEVSPPTLASEQTASAPAPSAASTGTETEIRRGIKRGQTATTAIGYGSTRAALSPTGRARTSARATAAQQQPAAFPTRP